MTLVLVKQLVILNRCCGEDKVAQLLMGFIHLFIEQVLLFLQAVSLLGKLLILSAVL